MVDCHVMMPKHAFNPTRILIVLMLVAITGCSILPEPTIIIVTPTPAGTEPTVIPTLDASAPRAETRVPVTPGPIIVDNYTLEPTSTPRFTAGPPTETIPPRPSTFTPGPSWTPFTPEATISPSPAGPATATSTPIPLLDKTRMGIQLLGNTGRAEWDASLTRAKELGVEWIKVQVNW